MGECMGKCFGCGGGEGRSVGESKGRWRVKKCGVSLEGAENEGRSRYGKR